MSLNLPNENPQYIYDGDDPRKYERVSAEVTNRAPMQIQENVKAVRNVVQNGLNNNGTVKSNKVVSSSIAAHAVTEVKLDSNIVNKINQAYENAKVDLLNSINNTILTEFVRQDLKISTLNNALNEALAKDQLLDEIKKIDGKDSSAFVPMNTDWAGGSGSSSNTLFGGVKSNNGADTKFTFSASGHYKMDVITDGNFYANEGRSLVWHSGNDGAGSGLDADKLDGLDSSQFLRKDTDNYFPHNLIMNSGKGITFRSLNNLGSDYGRIQYDADNDKYALWGNSRENSALRIFVENDGTNLYSDVVAIESPAGIFLNAPNIYQGTRNKIWHEGNDGKGSGLDADKLDGLDSSDFAKIQGDNTKTFKVADAVHGDEAVSKRQLLSHYPTLTYVEYTTGTSFMSISQPKANTWFDLPHVKITIPENGIYVVTYDARISQQDLSTNRYWKKSRVLKNGTEITKSVLFGFDKNDTDINQDSTVSKTFIDSFVKGEVLQLQGYWANYTSGSTVYSNINGSTSIVAIKIG